jgi:hypothetical protein
MKFKFIFISALLLLYLSTSLIHAQHFTSDSYIIDWGNFNMTSGHKSSTNYHLTDTVGQNAPGLSEKNGIRVKAGFQYIYDMSSAISFTIDKLNIDFGTLVPGIGVTDTNLLTVTTPSGRGYQIMAQENHPLWINSSNFIANTTCDANDCTPTLSAPWTSSDKYGFGYNVTGIGATAYFLTSTHFRPFADFSQNQEPAIIASESSPVKNREAMVTYRVLVSPLQSAGNYENYITYTLVPRY